jgi:hypothetical protein
VATQVSLLFRTPMIDRKIHQIWLGHMPKSYSDWCAKMARMNPDFQYKLWREELLDRYAKDPYVEWMRNTGERTAFLVDRIRVLLLRDEGGIYADADCYPVRPFKLLDEVWNDPRIEFVAAMRNPDRRHVSLSTPGVALVDNTVLASCKGSEMSERLVQLYQPAARRHTGFSMGREIIRNAGPKTLLLAWRYFYSENDNPEAIVLHDGNNAGSWLKPNEPHEANRP